MTRADRERLRATFEEVPDLYDCARPAYPAALFSDLLSEAHVLPGARVLEIGCGTGQATRPLAERGLEIVCIELGEQLASLAKRNLAQFPRVEIITADFEGWETAATFDAVVAFTAFHWIDANIRYEKCARHLSDTGALAVVETRHVLAPDGDQFFVDVQQDYELLCPSDPQTTAGPPGPPEDVGDLRSEIDGSGVFRATFVGRYLWDVAYRADEYITVLETYSGHRAIDDDTRERLYQRIRRRITSRPSCLVTKTYLATLNVAQKI